MINEKRIVIFFILTLTFAAACGTQEQISAETTPTSTTSDEPAAEVLPTKISTPEPYDTTTLFPAAPGIP